jgi:hypothetical protein
VGAPITSTPFAVRFFVANKLIAPVSVFVDGNQLLALNGGQKTSLAVSPAAQWLTWNSAKPMDAQGRVIPDDINEVQIGIGGIRDLLEITNVINDQTYITAAILNNTDVPVSIGVYDGSSVACASELPARKGTVSGFTQIGYYKLLDRTEIRVFRETQCAGPYLAWSGAQLKEFDSKSGLLRLTLDSAP